jgi:hypothetical protein
MSSSSSSESSIWVGCDTKLKPHEMQDLRKSVHARLIEDLVDAEAPFDMLVPRANRFDKVDANVARIRAQALLLEPPDREAILYMLDRIDTIDDNRYSREILLIPYALPRKLRAALYYSKRGWGFFTMRLPCRGLRCSVQLAIKYGMPANCRQCEVRATRRRYLDIVEPLIPLELPSYVLMWLIGWLDRHWRCRTLSELELLRLIDAVGAAWRNRIAARRPASLSDQ